MQLSLGDLSYRLQWNEEDNGDIKRMRGSKTYTAGRKTVFELTESTSSTH